MPNSAVIQGFFPGGPPRLAGARSLPLPGSSVQRIPNGVATQLPAPLANLHATGGQTLPPAVREKMEGAVTLDVPLDVDVGVADNWRDAKP